MKNQAKRVFRLTTICFLIYLLISVITRVFNISWEPFARINLISEIFNKPKHGKEKTIKKVNENVIKKESDKNFDLYKKPEYITNFYNGNSSALPALMLKIEELSKGKPIKIRIAYFGDSMIEGDLLTQTLRKLLQNTYGGNGVGYLPIYSKIAGFRQTATVSSSGWNDVNFMTKGASNLYFSGHKFSGSGIGNYTDNTFRKDSINIEKSIIYSYNSGVKILVNGQPITLNGTDEVNRQVITNDTSNKLSINGNFSEAPVYGVSFESKNGIIVDNFSFRGITGVEYKKLDENFLKAIQKANHYDLIVFQYGVNLLFRPNDTDYSYYSKLIAPVFTKFKNSFPDAEFLLISSADRAFRYDGNYKTAKGLPNLIETQAQLAFDYNFAFYNQFESMGGENSIVKWAMEKPPLANKDYIHPNHKGADVLAEKLFKAIQNDYKKYLKTKTP